MQRTELEIERLVTAHQKLVHYQVNRFLKRYAVRGMERDDLVSCAQLGLMKAARMWDPQRGAFSTVACRAIEWALLRGTGRECRARRALEVISLDELFCEGETAGQQERIVDRLAGDQHVEREHLEGETRAAVRSAVAALPALERRLIERRFFEEVPLTRVAVELGISRQSLCERQRKAVRRLRAILDHSVVAAGT